MLQIYKNIFILKTNRMGLKKKLKALDRHSLGTVLELYSLKLQRSNGLHADYREHRHLHPPEGARAPPPGERRAS